MHTYGMIGCGRRPFRQERDVCLTIRDRSLVISRSGREFLPGLEADYRIIAADHSQVKESRMH